MCLSLSLNRASSEMASMEAAEHCSPAHRHAIIFSRIPSQCEVNEGQTIIYSYYECRQTQTRTQNKAALESVPEREREQTGRRRKLHEWYLPVEASMLDE